MSIEIREAAACDAAEMLKYIKQVGGETDYLSYGADTFNISIEKEARFLERFRVSGKNLMLVALDKDRIVANASIEGNRTARYSHRAELSITVLRDYWNKGIGSSLMRELLDFAKSVGYKNIYLDVRADNLRAISLYRKFGFELLGTYKDYFKISDKYFDAEIMVLYI